VGAVAQHKGNPSLSPSPFPLLQQGFTLIELLVVLVVMGIALGLVVVQLMPDDRATLREEAQRLALLLENAGLEARASGRPLAWSAEKNGYRFWNKNDYGDWVRIENDAAFRPRILPDAMHIAEVTVEMQRLQPGEQLSLNSASFALPFRIRLISEHASASITGSSTGTVSAKLDGESDRVIDNVQP
jgi:general secretion pathway protein H